MEAEEIRFLFAYDRWATRRVLDALDGVGPAVWARDDVVGERGLGAILVHHLGASQRWRHGFQDTGESPRPEEAPLPTVDGLHERWETEWAAVDAWLPTLTDDFVVRVHEGVPLWQMLVHVVNHGTQHRAEAAALLTAEGRSPGELDLIEYAEERAANAAAGSVSSPDQPAPHDRSFIEENDRERARMRALVDGLDDEALASPVNESWTVAGVLGHVAFWDQRVLSLAEKLAAGVPFVASGEEPEDDVDWINDASSPFIHALAPREAAELALRIAEETDARVATLPADRMYPQDPRSPINAFRSEHRAEHLDEVEAALRARG